MRPIGLLPRLLFVLAVVLLGSAALNADNLSFNILNPNRFGVAGEVFTFDGTITNNTGIDLNSTDLFLDFSGYDPDNVTLDQLLGLTDFTIPNGSTSQVVDLFTFTLATTAPAGTYPADVVLQAVTGDIAGPQTVTVTTVPEPGSLTLLAAGLPALLLGGFRRKLKFLLPVLFLIAVAAQTGMAQLSGVRFITGPAGLGTTGPTLMSALPITNNGTVTATNVKVTSATLHGLGAQGSFPVILGTMAPGQSAVFQGNFDTTTLSQHTPYLLTIRGTYQVGASTGGFTLNRFITLPVPSPGSNTITTGNAGSHFVTGGHFQHQPPNFGDEVNSPRPPVPTGPFMQLIKTETNTGIGDLQSLRNKTSGPGTKAPIIFELNAGVGINSAGTNCNPGVAPASCAEPSGANGGGVIFVSANWTAAYSLDNGSTFTQIDPTTIFPNDAIGFCCDQQIQYVASIDRFIWLLQGNGMRIASASPQQFINSGGTAWTYWNLGPTTFGQPTGTGFDYPDISVGSNELYLSWDVGFPNCPTGCTSGLEVVRIPLSQLQAGGTIFFDYTHPGDSSLAWGSHLTQDTGNEIFWAGHDGNSQLRVFSLAEGSNTYFWRDVGISSWPNNTLTSATPDGQDWLKFGFPGSSIIGATRSSDQLWFAWGAGTNDSFSQPHVQMVTLDRSNNFQRTQQVQVWNNNFAFSYPALATNVCTGEVGMSLGFGGNGNFENHVVGIWGDFEVFLTTNSGSGVNRYGDYNTIRINDDDGLFDALGYGISTVRGSMQSDVRYVVFGRSCDIGKLPKHSNGPLISKSAEVQSAPTESSNQSRK